MRMKCGTAANGLDASARRRCEAYEIQRYISEIRLERLSALSKSEAPVYFKQDLCGVSAGVAESWASPANEYEFSVKWAIEAHVDEMRRDQWIPSQAISM